MTKNQTRVQAGRKARRRGKDNERGWVKKLDVILSKYSPWIRNLGENGWQEWGDLLPMPLLLRAENPWYVECKYRERATYSDIIKWMEDAQVRALPVHKSGVLLCVRVGGGPWMIFCTMQTQSVADACADTGVFFIKI